MGLWLVLVRDSYTDSCCGLFDAYLWGEHIILRANPWYFESRALPSPSPQSPASGALQHEEFLIIRIMTDLKKLVPFPGLPDTLLSHWPSPCFPDVLKSFEPPHLPEYVSPWLACSRLGLDVVISKESTPSQRHSSTSQHPTQCHLIHLLGPHHQCQVSPDCLRRDMMGHNCPSPAPSGASTEPILHPHVIIPSLVFGQPKVLQIRTCRPEGCGHRMEERAGTDWQNDVGLNQKLGTFA